jgi:hypothetical protein
MRPDHMREVNLEVCSKRLHCKVSRISNERQTGIVHYLCDKHAFELSDFERYECIFDDFECRWKR